MTNPKFSFGDIPESNWLMKYCNYHLSYNRASYPEYIHAGALAIIQMHTGRRVYIRINGRRHYSNLNIVCLGPTGANKTDAATPVVQWMLDEFRDFEMAHDFSGAGFKQCLEEHPQAWLINDEAGTILNRIRNSKEAETIRDSMCRIYDNAQSIKVRLSKYGKSKDDNGSMEIKNPWLVTMLMTTPETFSQNSVGLDLYSGWLPRFLFYNPNYTKESVPLLFGGTDHGETTTEKELLKEMRMIEKDIKQHGEIECILDAEIKTLINRWKEENEKKYESSNMHLTIFKRLMIMAIKLAINYQLGDEDPNIVGNQMIMKKLYVQIAIDQVDKYFFTHSLSVFDMLERDASRNIQDKIISKLTACGGMIEQWRLSRELHITAKIRDEHLHALMQSREIVIENVDGTAWVRFFKDGDLKRLGGDLKLMEYDKPGNKQF